MTCTNCGAELPADAKFCHQCGTAVQPDADEAPTEVVSTEPAAADEAPVDGSPAVAPEDVDVPIVDPTDPAEAPPTEPVEPAEPAEPAATERELPRSPALPVDPTATGVTSPALQQSVPTPPREPRRRRRPLEERGTWEEFTAAVVPLLRAPRFTGNLLAALIALAVSVVAALIVWALFDNAWNGNEGILLPGFVDTDRDPFGVIALLGLIFHQVPMISGDDMTHAAPLLLGLIPLLGCALGIVVARRVMPCSGKADGFAWRALPFVLIYAVLTFTWSLFGAQGWHAAHLRSLLAGLVFALLGAWLAERWIARRSEADPDAAPAPAPAPGPAAGRFPSALRTGSRVFVLMVLLGSLGWLVGTIVAQVKAIDNGRAAAISESVLHVLEGGFEAVGFGVLAEGAPMSTIEDDGWRIFELGEVLPDAAAVIYLIVALMVVIVGGLFSGFAIARRVEPRSRNDHALYGAITGLVWAGAMLLAHLVVLLRIEFDDETTTAFNGSELFFFSLIGGAALGALGGLLASHATTAPAPVERAAEEVAA